MRYRLVRITARMQARSMEGYLDYLHMKVSLCAGRRIREPELGSELECFKRDRH